MLASVCGCSLAPLPPPLCSWQGPCLSVELRPAQPAPSWEDARGRTQASAACEAKSLHGNQTLPPEGGHWLWFSRPWEGSWNPQAGETGVQTKGSLPWITGSPGPSREAMERRSKPGSPSPPSSSARMALKAWSPKEVSALCLEGSELWRGGDGGAARLRQREQDAG